MRSGLALLALALLALDAAPSRAPQGTDPGAVYDDDASLPEHADDVADYTMTATLDPVAHTVHGEGTIHWRNTSSAPVKELWLHLYLNAFKNEGSVFLREPVGRSRGTAQVTDWGYIDVRKLTLRQGPNEGPAELWPTAELHRAGDDDETDVRVPLPREIVPDESIDLDMVWDDKLPSVVERTGYSGTFHMVAQWFPKLARLEPSGTWAHFPFHHLAEFYADFGTYDVTMKVPAGYRLAATGFRTEERDEGGFHVERHVQGDIHDFAFSAYDHFEMLEEGIGGVDVKVFYPTGYRYAADRELETMRFALPHFGKRYGKYPYPVLTLVHPPDGADEAGGMEYPTLITTGGPWFGPPGVLGIELVTIHEFGHQYFYGMLASDEMTWPFLDEGINSYAEAEGLGVSRGSGSMLDLFGLHVSDESVGAVLSAKRAVDAPVAQPAYAFTGPDYGALVYARTATIFATIDHVYGHELGAKAIGRYARRARFRHPVPDDLLTSYEEVLGPDVRATLHEALFAKGWVDYRMESVQSTKVNARAGVFDRDGKRETVTAPAAKEGDYEGWALVFRHGTLRFPVDVDFVLEDGTTQRASWDGEGDFARVPYRGAQPLKGAIVDPDHKVLVDRTFTNNFATATGTGPTKRTFERALFGSELLFSLVGP